MRHQLRHGHGHGSVWWNKNKVTTRGRKVLGVVHSCCEIWCFKNLWAQFGIAIPIGFHNVFLGPKIVIFMGFKPWKWGFNRSSHQKWLPKSAREKSTKPWNGWQEPQEAEGEESYSEEDRCSPRTKAFSFVDVSVAGTRVFTSKATLNQPLLKKSGRNELPCIHT